MSNESSSSSGGLGCSIVLQIVFIVLKLLGLINWPWLLVMSPTLIVLAISAVVVVFLVFLVVAASKD